MALTAIAPLKFVGTVSLGLLTGVSFAVSRLVLPSLLQLPSAATAADSLAHLATALHGPLAALSSLAAAPLALSFVLAPRHGRHPYLVYASLLAALSYAVPRCFFLPSAQRRPAAGSSRSGGGKKSSARAKMEASYEVLGDDGAHSDPTTSEEDAEDVAPVNGEDVGGYVRGLSRGYAVQAGLAAAGFALSVIGLWGDGAPVTLVVA